MAPPDRLSVKYIAKPRSMNECDCDAPNVGIVRGMYPFRDMTMQACQNCHVVYVLPETGSSPPEASFENTAYLVPAEDWKRIATVFREIDQARGEGCGFEAWDLEELLEQAGLLEQHTLTAEDKFPCTEDPEICGCIYYHGDCGNHIGCICYRPYNLLKQLYASAVELTELDAPSL